MLDCLALLGAALLAESLLGLLQPLFNEGGLLHWYSVQHLGSPQQVDWSLSVSQAYAWLITGWIVPVLVSLSMTGNYAPLLRQSVPRIVFGCLGAALAGLSVVSLFVFLCKGLHLSRFTLVFYALASTLMLSAYRLLLRLYYRAREKEGLYAANVLLVGHREAVARVASLFDNLALYPLYRLTGYVGDEETAGPGPPAAVRGHLAVNAASPAHCPSAAVEEPPANLLQNRADKLERLGDFGSLRDLLNNRPIQKVVMVLPAAEEDWPSDVLDACDELGVMLQVVPETLLLLRPKALRTPRLPEDVPLPGVLFVPTHHKPEALFLKRCVDVVGSALALLVLSPLMAIVAILIKIGDPRSPVIYRFRALGQNGAPFQCYKFRSMIPGAHQMLDELWRKNEMRGPVFKMKNDPRITPLGCILRKYSIDELPQLWNVLRGDLSLVGPRQASPHELRGYAFWHKRRLCMKPGLTCFWQIRGRNVTDFDDRVGMDLEYIEKWSLWLDFKILLLTIPAVLRGTGQ